MNLSQAAIYTLGWKMNLNEVVKRINIFSIESLRISRLWLLISCIYGCGKFIYKIIDELC